MVFYIQKDFIREGKVHPFKMCMIRLNQTFPYFGKILRGITRLFDWFGDFKNSLKQKIKEFETSKWRAG